MANKPMKGPKPPLAPPQKQVRSETQTATQNTPVWVFGRVDLDGRWCWTHLSSNDLRQIIQRLGNLERMTWSEIEQSTKSHFVKVDDLIKEANDRLAEIKQDDVDELFSLRVTNIIRLWGIRVGEEFHFLWCDPNHEVCPSKKK